MKRHFLLVILTVTFNSMKAQVGIGTTTPHTTAILELKDSTKGILIPRLTMAQRNAIVSPAEGLMIYQKDSTKGFWYYDGVQWKNVSAFASTQNHYGGKTVIVLSDTITNNQAILKIASEVGPNTQEIKIVGCTALTSVDLSMISTAVDIYISSNKFLSSLNLNGLRSITGHFYIENCPNLFTVNLPSLENITFKSTFNSEYAISFSNNANLATVNFTALKNIVGSINFYKNKLTNVSFPVLSGEILGLYIYNNSTLTSFTLPNLNYIQELIIENNPQLTSLSFPALTRVTNPESYYGVTIQNNTNLSSVTFGQLLSMSAGTFLIKGKLPSSNVNALLNNLVSITPLLTSKTILLSQNPPAPPTGQGLTDKATLVANSNNVVTN